MIQNCAGSDTFDSNRSRGSECVVVSTGELDLFSVAFSLLLYGKGSEGIPIFGGFRLAGLRGLRAAPGKAGTLVAPGAVDVAAVPGSDFGRGQSSVGVSRNSRSRD